MTNCPACGRQWPEHRDELCPFRPPITDRPTVAAWRAEWETIRRNMADTPARAFTDRLMAALEAGPFDILPPPSLCPRCGLAWHWQRNV